MEGHVLWGLLVSVMTLPALRHRWPLCGQQAVQLPHLHYRQMMYVLLVFTYAVHIIHLVAVELAVIAKPLEAAGYLLRQ
jgi:hypothetical protein